MDKDSDNRPQIPDKVESRRKFIINFTYVLIMFGLSILLVRYALPALLPFIIAFIVAVILKPVVKFVSDKCHLNRKAAALIIALIFYATIGVVFLILVIQLIKYLGSVVQDLPDFFYQSVIPTFRSVTGALSSLVENLDVELPFSFSESIDKIIGALGTTVANFSGTAFSKLANLATSVPSLLISILITIIATVFILMDYDVMKAFFIRQLPENVSEVIHHVTSHLGKVLKKYILSYALIMFITFLELFLGLKIIGVGNTILIAALIAVFDILPVVGSGTILMPWAIVCLITGSFGRAIGLVIVWAVISVIRNIIEPKIIGSSVGVHPLATLFAMLAGNFVYGGIGILLVPVALALCQSLNNAGIIRMFRTIEVYEEENEVKRGKIMTAINAFFDRIITSVGKFIKKIFKKKKK